MDFENEDTGLTQQMVAQALPVNNMDQLDDAEFDKLYSSTMDFGDVSTPEVDEKIASDKKAHQAEQVTKVKETIGTPEKPAKTVDGAIMDAFNPLLPESVQKGVAYGMRSLVRNTYNSLVEVTDFVENYAASKGFGTGNIISKDNKIDKNSKDSTFAGIAFGLGEGSRIDPSQAEKIAQIVTEIGVPLVGSMGAGVAIAGVAGIGALAGAAAGVTVDSAINALVADEGSGNLSTMLQGTAVAEIPAAATALEYLAVKPDDTEMTRKFKIFSESMGLGGALGAAVWGLSKLPALKNVFKGVQKAEQGISDAQAVAGKIDDAAPTGKGTPKPKKIVDTPEEIAEMNAQISKLEPKPVVKILDEMGAPANPGHSDELLARAQTAMSRVENVDLLRTPTTDAETKIAAQAMKNDPEIIDRIFSSTPDARVLTDTETVVLKEVLSRQADQTFSTLGTFKTMPEGPVDKILAARSLENMYKMLSLADGQASAKGATLRAEQVAGELAGYGVKDALTQMGGEGRSALAKGVIDSYGGPQKLDEMLNSAAFVAKIREIAEIPNEAFRGITKQMLNMPQKMSIKDKVVQLAFNSMLSIKTLGTALISNTMTTATSVAESYLRSSFGSMTLEAANAHASAVWSSMWDMSTITEGMKAIKNPLMNNKFFRADLDYFLGGKLMANPDQMARRQLGGWAAARGFAHDVFFEGNTRLLAGADTYWNIVNQRGFLMREATMATRTIKDSAERTQAIKNFMDNPPADIAKASYEAAGANTMSKDLTGEMEAIYKGVTPFVSLPFGGEKFGLGKLVQPFMKSSLNAMEYGIEHTPFSRLYPKTRDALKAGGAAREEALAKMASGTTILGAFVYANHAGLIKVNGPWSGNKKANMAIPSEPELSVTVDGVNISLKNIEPLGSLLGLSHIVTKSFGYMSEGDTEETALSMAAMLGETFLPEQLMDTMTTFGKLFSQENKADAWKKFASDFSTKLIPQGGNLRLIRGNIDEARRDTSHYNDFYDMMKAKWSNIIPFFSDNLPPQRDMFGNKIEIPDGYGPDGISPVVAADKKTGQIKTNYEKIMFHAEIIKDRDNGMGQYSIEKPGTKVTLDGAKIELTAEQYSRFLLARGGKNPDTGKSLDGGMSYQEMVEDVFKQYKFDNKRPQDMPELEYYGMVSALTDVDKVANERGRQWLATDPSIMNNHLELQKKQAKNNMRMLGSEVQRGR